MTQPQISLAKACLQVFFHDFQLGNADPGRPIDEWDIRKVIWHMIRTKRYCPHAHWCIPQQGKGMWWLKAQALWRLRTATQEDVDIVLLEAPAHQWPVGNAPLRLCSCNIMSFSHQTTLHCHLSNP